MLRVILPAAALLIAALFLAGPLLRRLVRRALTRGRARPLPAAWAPLLDARMPVFRRLTPAERDKLLRDARDLLETRRWEGAGGLVLTEPMRLLVAAQAALLTLAFDGDPYPALRTVLVYPSTFVPGPRFQWGGPDERDAGVPKLGESWDAGTVVLAWDGTQAGAADPADGHNLVLHEFAHQLDRADGATDGVPRLPSPSAYRAWAALLEGEFRELGRAAEIGEPTVLDPYGATAPAELFAVATEAFFERSDALRRERPALWEALHRFYRQDPARFADPG